METGWFFFDQSAYHENILFHRNATSDHRGAITMISMEENSKRSPFLSTGEDDEYYEEQFQEKKRRLTPEQVHLLEKSFEEENKLEPERKTQLAKKLSLQPRQVAVWFQNRRARWKTKQLERDYDVLKSSFDSLFSNYNAVVKDNENLKSEVISLTVKLQSKDMEEAPIHAPSSKQPSANVMTSSAPQLGAKVKDGSSSGSGGSAVIDEERPQLLDSGDSCFVGNCVAQAEDDGRYGSRIYCKDGLAAAEQQSNEEGVPLHLWDWS